MGEDIRDLRHYLGFSQFYISIECGWGCNYIAHIESGKIKNISYKNAHKLAVFFVNEIKKRHKTIKEVEEYLGYFPFLDLLYVIENKDRNLDDII